MQTTVQFLDAVKIKTGIESDYALAKLLGVGRAAVSRYRNPLRGFSDEAAIRVAELLEIDPGYVMACTRAQRAKRASMRKLWEGVAKKVCGASVAGLVALAALSMAPESEAATVIHYTIYNLIRPTAAIENPGY